ncbi:MAG: benzoyl-CoA 2,3-epoxidase subunit BoxB [Rhodospirillaceae bacterium]|jgi:benzoyl-CoA 2,3-epoxidase subunit B|nr:benzoyl-CoA 2,3-epoxidase subunit BoxB [Rhodospirillaceae bacterium]MBT4587950.1 benzoyl-CoA 2,3-epoxidase subunit BoxB [Rhodospirillaceae bacterium]MBT4938646.1 benzoyl-CoA 2,3-epoxidase subunit BoxB [Rhodospirillaceae bacterium]MBT5941242.1 benzoyl-CoA 2,3-epoxidase subunit BoxB [Rhodospirillaceae bacterium]MBT7265875.1 benzoyl-CoA 2,3-epoxidase subunit BoxB [Rhodospirillaceae bacterium]
MTKVDYSQKIPNNVNLSDDRRLQRALEAWQPAFLNWWDELGPDGSHDYEVFLRTAIDVSAKGWAHFDMVKMPEYRWGIFLADKEEGRKVNFGSHKGEDAWQEVPGEYRAELRRLIVTQGDTEPASVEQQRQLGKTCPSLYDLRSLFQVNVEEGRHLWAMVYLLHAHFGRDGREEADEMLMRHSGDVDKPRILEAFNIPTTDWLSFFCFTYFQDRDGKFQLSALAESGFDPLSRTCNFMLTEEAHHMFVGETGVGRVVQRSAELIKEHDTMDIGQYGGIPLELIQKWMNFHFSVCLDLFGQEKSTNAANFYNMGLKGRFQEMKIDDDHLLDDNVYSVPEIDGSKIIHTDIAALTSINERLRDDYREDCQRGVDRWNKTLSEAGIDFTLTLPHQAFHRNIGTFAETRVNPEGQIISQEEWDAKVADWLPTEEDRKFVESLMVACTEPGKMAGWIAAPARGIQGKEADFEYVKFH